MSSIFSELNSVEILKFYLKEAYIYILYMK